MKRELALTTLTHLVNGKWGCNKMVYMSPIVRLLQHASQLKESMPRVALPTPMEHHGEQRRSEIHILSFVLRVSSDHLSCSFNVLVTFPSSDHFDQNPNPLQNLTFMCFSPSNITHQDNDPYRWHLHLKHKDFIVVDDAHLSIA